MNTVELQEAVIEYAASIGIDKIGFTTAAPFRELKNRLVASARAWLSVGF